MKIDFKEHEYDFFFVTKLTIKSTFHSFTFFVKNCQECIQCCQLTWYFDIFFLNMFLKLVQMHRWVTLHPSALQSEQNNELFVYCLTSGWMLFVFFLGFDFGFPSSVNRSSPCNIRLCPPTSKTITCLLLCSLNCSIQLILTGSSSISQIN